MDKFIPIGEAIRRDKTLEEMTNIQVQQTMNKELQRFSGLYLEVADIFIKEKVKPLHALVVSKTIIKTIVFYIGEIQPEPEDEIDVTPEMADMFYRIFDEIMSFVSEKDLSLNDFFVIMNCMIEAFTIVLLENKVTPEEIPFSVDFYKTIKVQKKNIINNLTKDTL